MDIFPSYVLGNMNSTNLNMVEIYLIFQLCFIFHLFVTILYDLKYFAKVDLVEIIVCFVLI